MLLLLLLQGVHRLSRGIHLLLLGGYLEVWDDSSPTVFGVGCR